MVYDLKIEPIGNIYNLLQLFSAYLNSTLPLSYCLYSQQRCVIFHQLNIGSAIMRSLKLYLPIKDTVDLKFSG
jgi:hypothetical protein